MAMRLLHTGDWHIGRQIRGRSRAAEFEAVLDELVRIAVDERVDAVLLAGDVHDGPMPTPDSDRLVLDTFLRLHSAGIPVVAIAGNHDSAPRLAAWRGVLAAIGVTVVPRVGPPSAGTVVEVPSRDGTEAAVVACVPFVPERRFGDAAALFEAGETWYQAYAQGMGDLMEAMASSFRPDRVNVLMAHLFTDGAMVGGGEREATIGIEYAVSPSRLPGTAAYVALGHVHRPQRVAGAPSAARYAGSLLQLDFGETGHGKSVAIVEARAGGPARVREVPLSAGRRLVDVRGTLDEIAAKAGQVGDAWLRVFVRTDGPVVGMADLVREHLPNAVAVHADYELEDEPLDDRPALASLGPREQFVRYHHDHHGAPPGDDLLGAFDEVLELVQAEEPTG
jgi:DNA repair protein SbcD/Mre11